MKTKSVTRLLLSGMTTALLSACACQIQPPPSVIGTDREAATKVAAGELGTSITKGEVSANYKGVVNRTYVTVSQDDVAFYLLLQAYNCESRRGNTEAAKALLQTARQELARRHKSKPAAVTSHPTTLTPTEDRVLKKSPLKKKISETLAAPKPE